MDNDVLDDFYEDTASTIIRETVNYVKDFTINSEVKGYSSRAEHLRYGIKTIDFIGFEKRK